MQIEDLLLDSQGALWVATRGGVSRFNGYSFDSFEDLNSRPGYCTEIIEDSKGQIIILGSDGVYLFNGRAFTFYKAPDNYRFNHLASMDVDDAGVVWINAYNASPILFKDSIYINLKDEYPKHQIDSVGQVFFHDQSKSLLIEMYRKGIFKLTQDTLIPVFKTDNGTRVISTHIDGSNSGQFFLREFDNSKSKFFSIDNELQIVHLFNEQLGEITAIENPIDQDVLFTERPVNNLFILEKGQSRSSKLISDLNGKFNYPGEVYVDDVGNFYLESDKGLIIINANRFEKLDESKVSNAWSINQLANGDMFFGGYGSGFKILDGEGIEKEVSIKERYYCKTGTISAQLQYIYMGSTIGFEGDLIIPTQETLLKFKDGEFRVFDYSKACKTMPSLYVFSDNTNKRILSATCNGLRILNENGELLRIVKEGLFDHRCLLTINQDKQDNYWIGATGGIAKYNYNTEVIKNYTKVNGGFPFNGVVCTYIDHKGTLWAGSREGLTYFDDKKINFLLLKIS